MLSTMKSGDSLWLFQRPITSHSFLCALCASSVLSVSRFLCPDCSYKPPPILSSPKTRVGKFLASALSRVEHVSPSSHQSPLIRV